MKIFPQKSLPATTLAACLLALAGAAALAQKPVKPAATPAKKTGFDKYEIVKMRNIFDPNRKPYVAQASNGAGMRPGGGFSRPQNYQPPRASDYVALTGVMVTDDKVLAFFSGSREDFNKVLGVDSSIAGATIKKITPSSIEVEREGKAVVVSVGQTVPLNATEVPGSPPVTTVSDTSPVSSGAPASIVPPGTDPQSVSATVPIGTSDGIPVAPNPSPAPAGDPSETMRRMIERRQQQLK